MAESESRPRQGRANEELEFDDPNTTTRRSDVLWVGFVALVAIGFIVLFVSGMKGHGDSLFHVLAQLGL